MIFKAILSSQASPGYGQATIHFPIPDSDYDLVIRMLEDIGVGSPTAQDCRVVGLEGLYPTLKRLNGQAINVDELDYLAKRLDSFSDGEDAQFEAMAFKLNLSSIKDFINLTFCCQQATVITNFSDLERVGKSHALTINGGATIRPSVCAPTCCPRAIRPSRLLRPYPPRTTSPRRCLTITPLNSGRAAGG